MPWRGDTPPFGFSTNDDTWLPIPLEWESLTVEKQLLNVDSTLSFFGHALEVRRSRIEFTGDSVEWLEAPDGTLAFSRGEDGLCCVLNAGKEPIAPPDGESLLTSAPLVDGKLPANAAAWVVLSDSGE
jgi:alpha-glucosidase